MNDEKVEIMKSILRKPDFVHYNNADHVAFHKSGYLICKKYEEVIGSPALVDAYRDKIQQEESIYKWTRRSEYTAKKAEADRERDAIYTGITSLVRINLKNFDRTLRDHAAHLYNLFENYGDVTHAGYDAETAAIDSLLSHLWSADYNPAVVALGLATWVDELHAKNERFKSYVTDTAEEQVEKPDIRFRAARRETDLALRGITDQVTALAHFDPTPFVAFAREFNVLVNHYNTLLHEHYGRLHARIDIAPAGLAFIPEQPWTGKPVYVIPTVTLRVREKDGTEKETELVFTRDFTVAYRNNVDPGTATLVIRGIGKYTGERITLFNIKK